MGTTAHSGEALELAVGLLRAPALRGALRTRPLSDGVGEVLAIASGSPAAARRAVERTGYDAAMLLEASRFYVQQVLLTEGSDAYRVLGADRHADRETLRNHHHLLQRWLHPDRSEGAQWDSALATRVNQAWNQLRTDAARAEYDAAEDIAAEGAAGAGAEAAAKATAAPPRHVPVPASAGGAAMATIASADPAPASRRGPVAVALLALACLVLAWLAIHREDPFDNVQTSSYKPAPTDTHAPTAASPELSGPAEFTAIAAPAEADAAAVPPAPTDSIAVLAPTEVESASASAATTAAALAATDATDATAATAPVGAATAAIPTPEIIPRHADSMVPTIPAGSMRTADATTATTATATTTATNTSHAGMPVAAPAAPPVEADPLRLFQEAEGLVHTVTVWLAATTAPHPSWLNRGAGTSANAVRSRLYASTQGRARARMTVDVPSWTLGDQAASMLGIYRLEDPAGGTLETGVFQIELARRDHRWQVAALTLDPML